MRCSRDLLKKIFGFPLDVKIGLLLFIGGIAVGALYFSTFMAAGGKLRTQQPIFGPAVMMACGKGWASPVRVPPLSNFLIYDRLDAIACDELPADLQITPVQQGAALRYLQYTLALTWVLLGKISWSGLAPLAGFLFGLVIALAYGIFRLGMNRWLAIIGSFGLTVSTLHLTHLPHIRDYAKAPFILALILIMGWLVTWPFKRFTILSLSTFAGLILGLGLGFRTDLLINILPFLIVLFCFLPGSIFANLKLKVGAAALFLISFLMVAWPIIRVYASGNSIWHVALLGFASPFTAAMDLETPLYSWGYGNWEYGYDRLVQTIGNSYAHRIQGNLEFLEFTDQAYQQATAQYYFEIASHFPADIIMRSYAAVLKILKLPFMLGELSSIPSRPIYMPDSPVPIGLKQQSVVSFYYGWASLLRPLANIAPIVAGFLILLISSRNLRYTLFLFCCLFYFAGYPAIQFRARHFFYLEFMAWWVLGVGIHLALLFARQVIDPEKRPVLWETFTHPRQWWSPPVQRLLSFGLASLLILLIPLIILRQYQHQYLGDLLRVYARAGKETLTLTVAPLDHERLLLGTVSLTPSFEQNEPVYTEYLGVEFTNEQCQASSVTLTFRYEKPEAPAWNLTHTMKINLGRRAGGGTQVLFPVYYVPSTKVSFQGIEIDRTQVACLDGVYRLKGLDQMPLLLILTLPSDWEKIPRYQTLNLWPTGQSEGELNRAVSTPETPKLIFPPKLLPYLYNQDISLAPKDLFISDSTLESTPSHFAPVEIDILSNMVKFGANQLIVKGESDERFSPLIQIREKDLGKESYFIAHGELRAGGFTLLLVDGSGELAGQVIVVEPGKFNIALEIPQAGTYSLVLANYLTGSSRKNDFVVMNAAWIE